MITIDSVRKTFDDVVSLNDVTITIENGSVFGLIGSNGSGKSTLMRILSGIYQPDGGEVRYDGEPVWENTDVKRNIVYLSDDQFFMTHATIHDMMIFYKSVYPSFSDEKYRNYLRLFGLDEKRRIVTFSKGMQKQVQFLIGISCDTKYLFCDETFDGLDPVMRHTVRQIIATEVAERGLTAIFASHNLKEIEDICDHVALLHKGEVIVQSGLDDIKVELHKIQAVFSQENADDAAKVLNENGTLSFARHGCYFTIIAHGKEEDIRATLEELKPAFIEFIPLTLDEIFIAEMEERGYDFSKYLD